MLVVPGLPTGPTLTVLGSGTLVPDDRRHGAAHLLQDGETRVLLDCGPGTLHGLARYGVVWQEITHMAISHYHDDHVGDLPSLLQAMRLNGRYRRTRPLTLLGPRGFSAFLERLAQVAGPWVLNPGFEMQVEELGPGRGYACAASGLEVMCMPTPHTRESVAYRVDLGGARVGYTGDTGPSELVAGFLTGCDVLVAECTESDPPMLDTHLSPSRLAAMAATARPSLLVVTHVFPPSTPERAALEVSKLYAGRVRAAYDGLTLQLEPGSLTAGAPSPVDPRSGGV